MPIPTTANVRGADNKGYLAGVEGLRGMAAMIVVIFHLFQNSGQPEWRLFGVNLFRPFHDGWCGVNLFLVLSGFCLFLPLARDPLRIVRFGAFMRKRFWRIIPAYYASLILVPAGYWILNTVGLGSGYFALPRSVMDAVLHLLLLQSFSPEAFLSWNAVSWSLGLEWTWYLVFPLAVLMFRRLGVVRAVLAMTVISVTYLCGLWLIMGPTRFLDHGLAFTVRNFIPGRIFEFGLGMWAAVCLADRRVTPRFAAYALFAAFPLLAAAHIATPIDPVFPVRNMLYGLAFTLLLLAVVSGSGNILQTVCESFWMRWIGESSYSLYLLHMPFVSLVTALLLLADLGGSTRFLLSLFSLPVILLAARWSYVVFERPFLQFRETRALPTRISSQGTPIVRGAEQL
jgi:peptidoglycan/LPS O-acetylase OafA/YrhL